MEILSWLHDLSIAKRFDPHAKEMEMRRAQRREEDYQEWRKQPTCCLCSSTEDVFQKSLGDSETQRFFGRKEAYCWRCDPYRGLLDTKMWPTWESYPYKHHIKTRAEFDACKRK